MKEKPAPRILSNNRDENDLTVKDLPLYQRMIYRLIIMRRLVSLFFTIEAVSVTSEIVIVKFDRSIMLTTENDLVIHSSLGRIVAQGSEVHLNPVTAEDELISKDGKLADMNCSKTSH